MKITVTRQDIEQGIMDDAHSCPVALAVSRAMPGWSVGVAACHVRTGNTIWLLPHRVTRWIDHFDSGDDVAPITFHLLRPSQGRKQCQKNTNSSNP